MRLSVFTPSHNPRYLDECLRSLQAQTLEDWEWVVLLNGKATSWRPAEPDPRVHVTRAPGRVKGVGAAKKAACEVATGDILVELDHDDTITPSCLVDVLDALSSDASASLAFSDFTQINQDGTPNFDRFNVDNGWVYTSERINGIDHLRCHAMQATPHNVGYIWYAPNHVRAFRRSSYDKVGGYDDTLEVLDDQELMIRLYEVGGFRHIDKCLYLQRMHGRNTQLDPETNAFIQQQTVDYYLDHIESLALAWAGREGLAGITLRTATSIEPGEQDERLQQVSFDPTRPKLPYDDGSVGVIRAIDILQRVPDRAAFLNECYRVLAHAGLLLTDTPSTDGRGAFQDPSHVAFYNENSFMYFTQAGLRPSIPTLTSRWQVSNLQTYWPSETHQRINIPYVKANLLAVKDGPRQGGPLLV